MKKLFLVFAVSAFFVACNDSATTTESTDVDSPVVTEPAPATTAPMDTTTAPLDSTTNTVDSPAVQ